MSPTVTETTVTETTVTDSTVTESTTTESTVSETATAVPDATGTTAPPVDEVLAELLVEEISIDGMCGVY
jgi:mycofactocin precursor